MCISKTKPILFTVLSAQIHEESEDGTAPATAAPPSSSTSSQPHPPQDQIDPVDAFPTSAAGVAVIRRLEQRRRLHKARTQSCSSSDASDDDAGAEGRRKRHDKSRTPPVGGFGGLCKRDSQHDDSSDSQDPGA